MDTDSIDRAAERFQDVYDRYLAAHPDHPTLAMCYDFQMLPHLDVESFDVPVQYVLSASVEVDAK